MLEENFTYAQVGELFLAVMAYTHDGTIRELPPELKFPFAQYRSKANRSKAKYEEKCAKLAENGAKGGKAKAAKAAGDHQPDSPKVKFTPPTLKQFRDAVAHFYKGDELGDDEPEDYDVDKLYDSLKAAGWKIGREPIQNRRDWEFAIITQLSSYEMESPIKRSELFKVAFGNFPELRDSSGNTLADNAACDFDEQYDKGEKGWTIAGEFYPVKEWSQALSKYIPIWQKEESSNC